MSSSPASPTRGVEALDALRTALTEGRVEVRRQHEGGRSGREVAAALTRLCDGIIERAYRRAIELSPPAARAELVQHVTLVALGGYGRGDLAPGSDVDLLFLLGPQAKDNAREFVARLVRDLWDIGLKLSQSVRTPADCISAARQDLTLRTALAEIRPLIGSNAALSELQSEVHRLYASCSINRFVSDVLTERAREHHDYHAQTVCLLEPNLKKSPGGLRDYHMLRWIALARHGIREPDMLRAGRILDPADADIIDRATEFLGRLRNEMHFASGTSLDVLTREEQMRLAAWAGFHDEGPLLGVERFMQQYYLTTSELHDVVMRFIEAARRTPLLRRMVNRFATTHIDGRFLLNRESITIEPEAVDRVTGDLEAMLQLFDLARRYGVKVAHEAIEHVRSAAGSNEVTPEARRRFLEMLAVPQGLGQLLRNLHRVGLLSRLLPPFEHARCLIQFNLYHKYTLDEHSLRVVESAARRFDEMGPIAQAYREIKRKDLLHLAMLLHDLGKGLGDDHSVVGARIAEETAHAFGLNDHDRQLVVSLVRHHLLMAHTAFRRDLSDDQTLVQFTREVATPEVLRMLYLMTAADTEAVSPENWTAWKESLLNELYFLAAEELTGETLLPDEPTRAQALRHELGERLRSEFPLDWLRSQLELMPLSYLLGTPAAEVAAHLRVLRKLDPESVSLQSRYLPETGFVEYVVFTRDDLTAGIFSKIAGVLAAAAFDIVTARIVTRRDGVVIDTFWGQDSTFSGEPPSSRREEVGEQIRQVLLGRETVEALFARRGRPINANGNGLLHHPPRVEIDNETSNRFTIVEVFADDRQGRLYNITRSIFESELSIASAKISTHGDQIVDVFYVTTRYGQKLASQDQIESVRCHLLSAIGKH